MYYYFKTYIIGKKGVGKFTFAKSCSLMFDAEDRGLTSGVYYRFYDYFYNPANRERFARFAIWVQNPGERFKFFMSSYIIGSNAILIMFDISDQTSLDEIDDWMSVINGYRRSFGYAPIMLLGNKADLTEHLASSKILADSIVKKYSLTGYYEISAFETKDIESIFAELTNLLFKKHGFTR